MAVYKSINFTNKLLEHSTPSARTDYHKSIKSLRKGQYSVYLAFSHPPPHHHSHYPRVYHYNLFFFFVVMIVCSSELKKWSISCFFADMKFRFLKVDRCSQPSGCFTYLRTKANTSMSACITQETRACIV